jgi:enoyl-CoA hydratase/carnithine racemase
MHELPGYTDFLRRLFTPNFYVETTHVDFKSSHHQSGDPRLLDSNPQQPPLNLFDPKMFAELNVLMDQLEADPQVKVIVLDSADPDYFVAYFDIVRGGEVPGQLGAARFDEWPKFVIRLAQSRVISIAKLRGRARGHGSELLLACDMRFAY